MATGSMLVSCLAVALSFVLLKVSRSRLLYDLEFLLVFSIGVVLHLFIASVIVSVDLTRGLTSFLPLYACVAGGWAIAALFINTSSADLTSALKRSFALLVVISLLGVIGWFQPPTTGQYGKSVFPFTEPSHLALVMTPLLIFSCITSAPWRRPFYLAAAFLCTMALENLTMAAACLIAAALCLNLRHVLILSPLLIPALSGLDFSYYTERLIFDVESQNLSSLVYLQGWQILKESLERTNGFGLGFQQLGVFGTSVTASEQINLLMGDSLNLLDGGFNMAKLLSEFGIFGMLLLSVYLYYLIRAINLLRHVAHYGERQPAVLTFSASCIVGYLVELLLRGTGYFTSTGILLVFALLTWRNHTAKLS